jgi:hypothetical protein
LNISAKLQRFVIFAKMEVQELKFGHRRVCLYRLAEGCVPLVYSIDYHENGRLLIDACQQVGVSGFNLVTISGLRWNQELSPWPVETVVSRNDNFAGEAHQWLPMLTDEVVPQVERLLNEPPAWRLLAGYSLAGLFTVWTAHQTDLFTRILSASGSMWYPGWLEYAREHHLMAPVRGVYLSVGEQESTSRNAVLQTVGERTQALAQLLAERGVNVKFELNPGNHFKNPPLRVAKGIKWLMELPDI